MADDDVPDRRSKIKAHGAAETATGDGGILHHAFPYSLRAKVAIGGSQLRFLVFQHIACEHPGIFRSFLQKDGVEWDAVELDAGEAIPVLEDYDALWVMGGPMDVWDVEDFPWMVEEKRAIRRWVRELKRPFLGVCLGHQLLADALGGTCGPQRPPEVGILDIELTRGRDSRSALCGASGEIQSLAVAFGGRSAAAGGGDGAGELARLPLSGSAR